MAVTQDARERVKSLAELERAVGKGSRHELAPVWVLIAWPVVAGLVAFVGWIAYVMTSAAPLLGGCDNGSFLGGEYEGGAASSWSLGTATGFAFVLWLAGSFAIWRFWSRQALLFLSFAFVMLYVAGLVFLGHVLAPLIWGQRVCV